ncbi:AAEL001679-PA [Aedes aegypti]|uniref:AAEL001679-PA n=1 Tax=Aedes aegypti TaxID=7159 RepID=Q17KG5_AEDAE|nr:AAEL001679-PA [Aedes aegypti]
MEESGIDEHVWVFASASAFKGVAGNTGEGVSEHSWATVVSETGTAVAFFIFQTQSTLVERLTQVVLAFFGVQNGERGILQLICGIFALSCTSPSREENSLVLIIRRLVNSCGINCFAELSWFVEFQQGQIVLESTTIELLVDVDSLDVTELSSHHQAFATKENTQPLFRNPVK